MKQKDIKVPSHLAQNMASSGLRVQYDQASKKVIADKYILAWILQTCVMEFKGVPIDEIREKYIEGEPQIGTVPVMPDVKVTPSIKGIGTEDSTINEGTVRYDIRFIAIVPNTKERIELIINVEAQSKFRPEYPLLKRGIYYGCRQVSSQYGTEFTHPKYGSIKKVYSIWVVMNPPKKRENTITRYAFHEENMVGDYKEEVENYDLIQAVLVCLGPENKKHFDGLLKLLGTLLSKGMDLNHKKEILEQDFGIPMSETLESEVGQMCNLSEGIWEEAIEQGIDKGKVQTAKNLVTMGLSIENIAKATELPLATVQAIKDGKQ